MFLDLVKILFVHGKRTNKINQLLLKRFEREQGGDLFEISGDLDFGVFDSDYFEVVDENKNGLTLIEERYPKEVNYG